MTQQALITDIQNSVELYTENNTRVEMSCQEHEQELAIALADRVQTLFQNRTFLERVHNMLPGGVNQPDVVVKFYASNEKMRVIVLKNGQSKSSMDFIHQPASSSSTPSRLSPEDQEVAAAAPDMVQTANEIYQRCIREKSAEVDPRNLPTMHNTVSIPTAPDGHLNSSNLHLTHPSIAPTQLFSEPSTSSHIEHIEFDISGVNFATMTQENSKKPEEIVSQTPNIDLRQTSSEEGQISLNAIKKKKQNEYTILIEQLKAERDAVLAEQKQLQLQLERSDKDLQSIKELLASKDEECKKLQAAIEEKCRSLANMAEKLLSSAETIQEIKKTLDSRTSANKQRHALSPNPPSVEQAESHNPSEDRDAKERDPETTESLLLKIKASKALHERQLVIFQELRAQNKALSLQ